MQTNLTLILPTTQFTVSTHVTYDGTLAWFRLPLKLRITSVHAVVSEVLQSAEESCAEKKNEKVDEEKLNDEHQRKSKGENLLSNHFAPFISYAYVLQFDDISSLKSFKTNPSLTVGQDIDTGLTEILEELGE